MIRNIALILTLSVILEASVSLADHASPPMIYCVKAGTHSQGPNTIYFDPADCGGNVVSDEYFGSISTLQVNGGNGGFQVFQPAQKSRPGVWFYAMQGSAQHSVAVLYTRALQ